MLLSKRLWAVLLAAVLVAGLLVGFGDGDEAVAKEPRATIGKHMVAAAAFAPTEDGLDYLNNGATLRALSGTGFFLAPVPLPVQVVNIRKLVLFAYDNDPGEYVEARLYRARPAGLGGELAAQVHTFQSADNPQKVVTAAINPRRYNTANHTPYLYVVLKEPDDRFYGVQVVYSY